MLTYPEIRGVLAEMEQEFKDAGKKSIIHDKFSSKAIFVLAMVDKRLAQKVREKHDGSKDQDFLF